jgi:ABC-type lipoprotein release transport system permease subunit
MGTLIHADIFFFITSITVIIFTIIGIIVGVYTVRILNDMKHISETMSREGDKLAGDIETFREAARAEGAKVRNIADFFLDLFVKRQKAKREHRAKEVSHK